MNRTPRGKSHQYVQLYTSYLGDTELVMAGQDARSLVPLLLAHSGEQGLEGRVPSNPKRVQLFAHFDKGAAAVAKGMAKLVDLEFLVATDDSEWLYIRSWDRYQVDLGGSVTRSSSNKTAALTRYHNEGKHVASPKDGCELCEQAQPAVEAVPETATPSVDEGPTARDIKQKVWDRCDQLLAIAEEDGTNVLEAYLTAHEQAEKASVTYSAVKGIGEATLLNTVVSHAAATFLNATDTATLNFLHGVRRDHGTDVLWKMSDPAVANAKNPIAYLRGCYKTDKAAA